MFLCNAITSDYLTEPSWHNGSLQVMKENSLLRICSCSGIISPWKWLKRISGLFKFFLTGLTEDICLFSGVYIRFFWKAKTTKIVQAGLLFLLLHLQTQNAYMTATLTVWDWLFCHRLALSSDQSIMLSWLRQKDFLWVLYFTETQNPLLVEVCTGQWL